MTKKLHLTIFSFALASVLPVSGESPAGFTLQAGDTVRIETPAEPSPAELFAAEELARYLGRMLRIKTVSGEDTSADLTISLGTSRAGDAWWSRFPRNLDGPGSDSFIIAAEPGRLTLRGGGDRGTLYAVYEVLESAGCRWLMPGPMGEVVPELDSFTVPVGETTHEPAFFHREISSPGAPGLTKAEVIDWEVKNRLNRDFNLRNEPGWEQRGGGVQWHWIAHNYNFMLPPEDYFEKHPDWFALYKGRRVVLGKESANICTTNPEVIGYFSDFINQWFDENPEGSMFPLSPPDGMIRWCECPECLALGGKNFTAGAEGSMSRRQITFVNEVARRVGIKHPDRKILLLAYQNFVDPVEDLRMEPNVIVQPVNYGAFGKPMTHPSNQRQRERFEGWSKIAAADSGTPGIWDYILLQADGLSGPRQAPLPLSRVMAENLRFLHGLGGRLYFTQAGPSSDSNPFVFYATAKLLWNPKLDLEDLLAGFCRDFYGPAAGTMQQYWTLLEDAVERSDWNPATWPEITLPSSSVYTPEVLSQGFALLDQAAKQAQTEDQKEKVQWARASLETASRTVANAQPWRLARGEKFYVSNADAGEDVAAQVRGLASERRNSGDPEGSLTRLIERLPKRELPIVSLANGLAEASVLPSLGGRILRLRSLPDGKNVFFEPAEDLVLDNVSRSYLPIGGYEEYLGRAFAGPGWELAFEASPQPGSLGLHAAQGSLVWSRQIKLLEERPGIALHTKLQNTGTVAEAVTLRGHPEMTLHAPVDRLVLLWRKSADSVAQGPLTGGLPGEVLGAWAVFDPETGRGVVHRFDSSRAEAMLHVDMEQNTFNLEVMSKEVELEPGQSFELEQTWEVFPRGDLQSLEKIL
jgi:hypothetical protein